MEKKFGTQGILTERQANSAIAKLIYSIEGIRSCHLDAATQEIVVEPLPEADLPEIETTVRELIEQEKKARLMGQRVIKESKEQGGEAGDSLIHDVGDVFESDGSVRRDFAVTLFGKVDRLLLDLSLRHQAKLRKYPSMIRIATLQKCRYISSFPQNIHLVSEIPHRLGELKKVQSAETFEPIARLSPYALSPAVCFHCYEELSGATLSEPRILTSLGTCYRHEAPWRLGKHRVNEFGMRETVLFGDQAFVEATRGLFIEEVWTLFRSLGLSGRIETASDPFYFSEDALKGQHQLMANMKYELIVSIGDGKESFSIASFNNMGDSLCSQFEIRGTDGTFLHSGCIAFGIDRWVYALLTVHGADLREWPDQIKKIVGI